MAYLLACICSPPGAAAVQDCCALPYRPDVDRRRYTLEGRIQDVRHRAKADLMIVQMGS